MKKSYLRSSFKTLNAALMLAFMFFMTGNLQAQCDQSGYNNLSSPCAQSVCSYDSFCCDVTWDSLCASEALEDPNCCDCVSQPKPEVCGGGGECPYDGPPCDSGGGYDLGYGPCTDSVCGSDSFCCDTAWDSICEAAAAADENCKECTAAFIAENCGAGQECVYDGPPCDTGGGYAYGYGPCTDSVCSYDPFCCDIFWDGLCESGAAADENCVECTAEYIAANCAGCDDSLNDPELTACPSNITLCGPQNVFWTAPTATDADGCEDPVVTSTHNSGASFGVGTTPVTYTATDGEGGTDQCSFTVTINPLPMVDINQIDVPQWCQGVKILFAKVGNIADLAEPVTYFWTTGETTEEILVTENGTYSVEVMDGNGCVSTATTVVNENLAELLSAHTILVDDEMDMDASTVLSGGVGVLDADEVSIQNGSDITTFFVSALAAVDGSSNVNDWTVADSPLAFPPFIANPFNDTNDQVIAGTVTLSGSNYGNVTVKSGSTLNIGNGEMYMKSLTVQKGGTVNFNQSGILLIKQKMNIGMMCNINVDGPGVVVYVGDNASVGQGSTVAVDIYAPEGLDVGDSGAFMTTYMYGLFVSDELNSGDNVIWGWNLVCGEGGGVEPPVDSNCCTEGGNDGVGCDDAACEAQICADDSFCCDTAWDGICASAAIESCEVCGAEEPPVVSNCCTEGGNGGVGCDDAACEAQICAADSFCCDTAWDGICASAAAAECEVCDGGGTPTMQSAIGNQEQTIENRVDDFTVFPNPSDGVVNVGVQSYIGSAVDVTITNAMGQQVWFQHIEVLETARIAVDLSADRYPSGMYNMTLRVNDAILTKQIILSK